ncbi:MAG: heavy-metal-associated domain-containing protein [candidate division Zixibacteria bacterium]|nr:heavy-metal-associated domain-containing protein [candidate division Zixibacteria bacterium]MCI0596009.1 heavy-metal-associated domain-containing protein [candidate division Zixibacteria bacterium]
MEEKLECCEISCEGMKGRGCEERIEARLKGLPEVKAVQASHKENKVKLFVAAGTKMELGQVRTALTELGYQARPSLEA